MASREVDEVDGVDIVDGMDVVDISAKQRSAH
jgi:hypothetical protein